MKTKSKWITGMFLGLVVLMDVVEAGEKKPKQPPQVYPNVKSFSKPCDLVWSSALPLMSDAGFAPESVDRTSGFASFKWIKGQTGSSGSGATNEVKHLTTTRVGFLDTYDGFRVESTTLLLTVEDSGCKGQLKMSYAGLFKQMFQKYPSWYALESNGRTEDILLSKIETAVAQAVPVVVTVPESKSTLSVVSNPTGSDIELDGRFVGSTPSKFEVDPGKHEIKIKRDGHDAWVRQIDVLRGGSISLNAELKLEQISEK